MVENLYGRAREKAQTCFSACLLKIPGGRSVCELPRTDLTCLSRSPRSATKWNNAAAAWRDGEFYKDLSLKAIDEFESLAAPFCCQANTELYSENQTPCSILFLLDGCVKLTMSSIEGMQFTLAIAAPGEILGLAAAIATTPYECSAVAQSPCKITSMPRQTFLDFLLRYPVAMRNSARILSNEFQQRCGQLQPGGLA